MNKKLFALLFLLVGIIYLSPVKADMGAPSQLQVDIAVSKQSGLEFTGICSKTIDGQHQSCDTEYKTVTIPYNTQFTVDYITVIGGQKTAYIEYITTTQEQYYDLNNNLFSKDIIYSISGEVNLDNFVLINKTYDLSEAVHFTSKQNIIVFAQSGEAKLYAGPSVLFDEIGTIPNNTKLTYEYGAVEDSQGINGTMWGYVEYNGKKGWIPTANFASFSNFDNIVALEKNGRIMTILDTVIREYPFESSKPLSIVPAETRFKYTYESDSYLSSDGWYYIEYNGVKGWVNSVATAANVKLTTNDKTKIYKSADIQLGVADFTIPSNTVINSIYSYGFKTYYYYIEYEGKSGWLYSEAYCNADESVPSTCEIENIEWLEEEAIDPKLGEIEKNEEVKTEKKEVKKGIFDDFDTKEILIICVSFAVVIALTSFITIKLVNKKHKNKEVNVENEKSNVEESFNEINNYENNEEILNKDDNK